MTQQEWLEQNTIVCARMQARITPEQCRVNRSSLRDKLAMCKGCPVLAEVLEAPRGPATCVLCGSERGSGALPDLCVVCSNAYRRYDRVNRLTGRLLTMARRRPEQVRPCLSAVRRIVGQEAYRTVRGVCDAR